MRLRPSTFCLLAWLLVAGSPIGASPLSNEPASIVVPSPAPGAVGKDPHPPGADPAEPEPASARHERLAPQPPEPVGSVLAEPDVTAKQLAEARLDLPAAEPASRPETGKAPATLLAPREPELATAVSKYRPLVPPGHLDVRDDPSPSRPGRSGWWIPSTLGALGGVIGLIFLLRAMLRRLLGQTGSGGDRSWLEVLGRLNVAPRSQILLIRLGPRLLVVGQSAGTLSCLANIDDPEEVAGLLAAISSSRPHSATEAFDGLVGRFNREYPDHERLVEEGDDAGEFKVDRARNGISHLLARVRHMGRTGGTP